MPGVAEPFTVEVRAASPAAPAIVLVIGGDAGLPGELLRRCAERLARSGFTTVSHTLRHAAGSPAAGASDPDRADLTALLHALAAGSLGVEPRGIGLIGIGSGAALAIEAARGHALVGAVVTWTVPGSPPTAPDPPPPTLALTLEPERPGTVPTPALDRTVAFLARHLP